MRTRLGVVAVTSAALLLTPMAFSQQLEDPSQDAPTAALGTAFTYQGQLLDGGTPATGSYDLQLRLFNAASGGAQVGSPVVKSSVPVTGGLFTVELDFGTSAFTAQALWLDIGVRPGGTSGSFTILSPRQPLNPAPFAHYSKAGVATDVQCSGCVGSDDLAAGAVGVGQLGGGTPTSGQVLTATGGATMAWQTTPAAPVTSVFSRTDAVVAQAGDYAGAQVTNAPAGGIAATTVQGAINELDGEKSPVGHTHSGAGITGLTPGGVTYGGAGGTLVQSPSALFWDNANGRLGLGTASPSEQLALTGNLALPATTLGGSAGVLFLGGKPFLHNYVYDARYGNTYLGEDAGNLANPAPPWNSTGIGFQALASSYYAGDNTAVGYKSLTANTTASANTAVGAYALATQSGGGDVAWSSNNTAIGAYALNFNELGIDNTAVGVGALGANTTGSQNCALGGYALGSNSNGKLNTAVGVASLPHNTTASGNTALGVRALQVQGFGFDNSGVEWASENTALGMESLYMNQPTASTNGYQNTAVGTRASHENTTGSFNVAVGWEALRDNTSGGGNVAIGHVAAQGFNGDNQLFIGNGLGTLIWGDFNTKRVGIGMTAASYQLQLATDSAGKPNGGSWANSSDARLKRDIAPLSGALEKILRLQGVSFEWVNPNEHGGRPESAGFIAQDVEQVFPDWVSFIDPSGADCALVAPGEKVRSLTLPFEFDAYLVEAIREQQAEIVSKDVEIARLAADVASLKALVAELAGKIAAIEGRKAEVSR